jgi:predicted nucleotidyltransferase
MSSNPDYLILVKILKVLEEVSLESILVGNVAAVLQGAPVTTTDVDFLIRKTKRNLEKIRHIAQRLELEISQPNRPLSDFYRLAGNELTLDFIFEANIGEFNSIRARSLYKEIEGVAIRLMSLEDIIRSKKKAGRLKDKAQLPILQQTLKVIQKMK